MGLWGGAAILQVFQPLQSPLGSQLPLGTAAIGTDSYGPCHSPDDSEASAKDLECFLEGVWDLQVPG